jgi:uncharacterized membrane protein YdjX (TVP38/TMEM64 family)
MVLVFAMGWHEYLSFKTIGLNYDALRGIIADNLVLALLVYVAVYIAVVALSLPGAVVMTLSGGLLFGWQLGAPVTIVGATVGACLVFLVVQTSFGTSLANHVGPFVVRLRDGFQANALSYLLFLRLVPLFPFFVVNIVPALLGVPLRTFVLGTLIGIIPGTLAYTLVGAGLGSVVEAQNAIYKSCLAGNAAKPVEACSYAIDYKALVTPELIYAGIALGVVALIPVVLKSWSKRHAAA